MSGEEPAWWQREVIYEIYPLCFQDSDGDGKGDLNGITSRLDYLAWLGIGAIWMCPFYPSPMSDFGYDVSDHTGVDPIFGSLADFDRLLAQAHERNIRIILDFVPNHTSDRHPWFRHSRSSTRSEKRDWYIWRAAGSDGGPPNNWESNFGGSAWERDSQSDEFYYHAFLKQQPDLNWRNKAVRDAMYDVMRFWLRRGVDGLRVDAATALVEDALFRDDPRRPAEPAGVLQPYRFRRVFTIDRPETHEYIAEMRDVLDEFDDRVLIGEVHLPIARAMSYYGARRPNFHLPFNFGLVHADWSDIRDISAAIDQFLNRLPEHGWPNWVLGNHDETRIASRTGQHKAPLAALLLMTLPGTAFMYYGDELGLTDAKLSPDQLRDRRAEQMGSHHFARDPQRTPMPWTSGAGGGFTTGAPWLPVSAGEGMNVAAQQGDPRSLLNLYRRLIALRAEQPGLRGQYVAMALPPEVLMFERRAESQRLFVVANFADESRTVPLPDGRTARWLLSTRLDRTGQECRGPLALRALEGAILDLGRA